MAYLIQNFGFHVMSFIFNIRDIFLPPEEIIHEVGLQPSFQVLDYGCGTGSFSIPAAEALRDSGKVYAADKLDSAVQKVQKLAARKALSNIETICTERDTGLGNDTIDVVFLYDIFHDLDDPESVLEELYRVLKPDGVLSFSDHHMKEQEIVLKMTQSGLFVFSTKGKKTYTFLKVRREKNN